MSRVDVPTLECDRCGYRTQGLSEMACFFKLSNYNVSGEKCWDLCPNCAKQFRAFIATKETQA